MITVLPCCGLHFIHSLSISAAVFWYWLNFDNFCKQIVIDHLQMPAKLMCPCQAASRAQKRVMAGNCWRLASEFPTIQTV